MPYGGTTPEQDTKIERCVEDLMDDKEMVSRYSDSKERKSHAIAICKSSVLKSSLTPCDQETMEKWVESAEKKKTFGKGKLGSGSRFARCKEQQMKRKNPRTGKNYTSEEAEKICATIGRKAYGKQRFQKFARRGRSAKSSAAVFSGDITFIDSVEPPQHGTGSSDDVERFLIHVSGPNTVAMGKDNEQYIYSPVAHRECAESFVGEDVVWAHDGDFPFGFTSQCWADENGELYQVWNVLDPGISDILRNEKKINVSIKTWPTDINEKGEITRYEAIHTTLLPDTMTPGCPTCGTTRFLESSMEEQEMTDKNHNHVEKTGPRAKENKDVTEPVESSMDEDIDYKAKYDELKARVDAAVQSKLDEVAQNTVVSSIVSDISIADITQDKINTVLSGGLAGANALKDVLSSYRTKFEAMAKNTVLSGKADGEAGGDPEKEKEAMAKERYERDIKPYVNPPLIQRKTGLN